MKWTKQKLTAAGVVAAALLAMLLLWQGPSQTVAKTTAPAYQRMVILSDLHLPFRPDKVPGEARQQAVLAAKRQVAADINRWTDVAKVALLGDLAATNGDAQERAAVAAYLALIEKPKAIINGNHDYLYEDELSANGKRVKAGGAARAQKLAQFQANCALPAVYYSEQLGRYRLVFLAVDALDSAVLAQLSDSQLQWLRQELAAHRQEPTIIFFHAPLSGTLTGYSAPKQVANDFAQPAATLDAILADNPQVFLWVSGHTHTAATNPNFAAPVNRYKGRIVNLHNADMDRETIWTNSLYLYPDKVVVKTYDHQAGQWLERLERVIIPPV